MSGPQAPLTYTLVDVAKLTGRSTSVVHRKAQDMKLEVVSIPSRHGRQEKVKAIKSEDLERLSVALQNTQRRKSSRRKQQQPQQAKGAASSVDSVLDETTRTLEELAEKHEALARKLREAVEWIRA